MTLNHEKLRDDLQRIWWAGVRAVEPTNLIPACVHVTGTLLHVGDEEIDLSTVGRIAVVGAGKAGAGMAVALEGVLGNQLSKEKQLCGWVNVPADCLRPTQTIHLHAARPAGVNEPTAEGVAGTKRILELVGSLGPDDLCLCLISGGGSALLPAPIDGITLDDKVTLTRELAARGATIAELNAVRREISAVKGGGLAGACRAGRLVTLVLSDVLGDDLETIASGPTVPREPTPQAAMEVLRRFDLLNTSVGQAAADVLSRAPHNGTSTTAVSNLIIGNNALAVDAAGIEAERLGYNHAMISATAPEDAAEDVAARLMNTAQSMCQQGQPNCLISGGEPTVTLAPEGQRGLGGRNQQLALAALASDVDWQGMALLAAGTDGEDGPTDAAGAWIDAEIAQATFARNLDPLDYLRRNDAYHFFEPLGGLFKTGPTHTNVCDLRVLVVEQESRRGQSDTH